MSQPERDATPAPEHAPAPPPESLRRLAAARAWLVRLLRGDPAAAPRRRLTRWLFLRLLALVYLAAILSFWSQAAGLIGPEGILPAAEHLELMSARFGDAAVWRLPTLCWLRPDDPPVDLLCALGVLGAGLLFAGIAPRAALALLWACYLSLFQVGQVFLGFQWDLLLIERSWWTRDPPRLLLRSR